VWNEENRKEFIKKIGRLEVTGRGIKKEIRRTTKKIRRTIEKCKEKGEKKKNKKE